MNINSDIVAQLTPKGILAYLAVLLIGGGEWSTAAIGQKVNTRTEAMRDGLTELSGLYPDVVRKSSATKWATGNHTAAVQNLDSRRVDLIDDLKKYWDHWNRNRKDPIPFEFSASDGMAVSRFLGSHRKWDRAMWRRALNGRGQSRAIVHCQPFYQWLASLPSYLDGALDEYGKPLVGGGGKHGQAVDTEQGNRSAREAFLANNNGVRSQG